MFRFLDGPAANVPARSRIGLEGHCMQPRTWRRLQGISFGRLPRMRRATNGQASSQL